MQRRLLVGMVALVLVAAGCGDDDATTTTLAASTLAGIPVPDVVGQGLDFSLGALATAGLEPQIIEVMLDDVEPQTVVEQVPEAGTVVQPGATVVLTVVVDTESSTTTSEGISIVSTTTTTTSSSTTTSSTTTTTTQPQDTQAPILTGAEVLPESIQPPSCAPYDQASAYLTATDPSGIGLVILSWEFTGTYAGQGSGLFPVSVEGSGQLIGHISNMPDLWTGGASGPTATVRLTWRVRDSAGNERTFIDEFQLEKCGL